MPTLKELVVTITSDVSGILNGTKTTTEVLTKLGTTVNATMTKLEKFSDVSKAVGGVMTKVGTSMSVAVTLPLLAAGAAAVKSAASMEMLNAEFTTLLGDGDKAKQMLNDLATAAARTPFGLEDLANASKTMLAFGLAAEDVLPNLQMLGDIAGGNADKLKSLTLAFSQIQSTGRLMGQDLLQLINAGFNPLQTISQKTGETMADLKKRMEQGGISAKEVSEAFKIATSEGGLFFGGMERASQTFTGRLSTLKDNLTALGRQFGDILLPILSDLMNEVSSMVDVFSSFDDETKKVIITFAAIAAAIGPLLLGFGKLLVFVPELVNAVKLLTGPQAMGALITGGPILLGIAAAAGIIAAITINTIKARQEQARYNAAIAGQLSMQETQKALEEKRARIATEMQRLAELERQSGRQGVAQAIEASKARIEAMRGEAAQLSNIIQGTQRQVAEEARLAPIRAEEARKAEELARIEEERLELVRQEQAERERLRVTLRNIDALVASGAMAEKKALEQKIDLRGEEIEAIRKAAIEGTITAAAAATSIREQEQAVERYHTRLNELTIAAGSTQTAYYDSANQQARYWSYYAEEQAVEVKETFQDFFEKLKDGNKEAWGKASDEIEKYSGYVTSTAQSIGELVQGAFDRAAEAAAELAEKEKALRETALANKLSELDAETQAYLEANGLMEESTTERLAREISEAEAAGNAEKASRLSVELARTKYLDEQEKKRQQIIAAAAAEEARISAETEKKKANAKYKADLSAWGLSLALSIAQAAQAVIAQLTVPVAGPALAIAAGIAGAAQVAIVAANKPEPPKYAAGTDFAPGGAAIVGERGPELVNLPRGSQVVPAHRTMSGNSGGVTVNIYSPVAVNPSEAAAIMKQTGREMAFMGAM